MTIDMAETTKMVVTPKTRGFICTTAHPQGCAANVKNRIDYVKQTGIKKGFKKVLVIGSSTGYGLASRIVAAFGYNAQTIGVFFEKPAGGKRTASAGWYNSAAFEKECQSAGLYAKSINGDAFSTEIKQKTIDLIKADWGGEVDLVIYSIASPRRTHPQTGKIFNSVLKPIGQNYHNKTVNFATGEVSIVDIEPATDEEIENTVAVMGGEDWQLWLTALKEAGVLAKNVLTLAYNYIGPQLTYPIYHHGTIGRAKRDLEKTAGTLTGTLSDIGGRAYVSVNKCLVTQASSAIPVVPLYTSLLYKVMKANNSHEDCIAQIQRLFNDKLTNKKTIPVDKKNRIRIDDLEMQDEVQQQIKTLWDQVDSDNIEQLSDIIGFRREFYRLFGFEVSGIDYSQAIDVAVAIPSIQSD